ncbi:hypothetical protein BHM03_00018008 [Ensete ventricosum]|nr:hypothetical protein BHM03_00018008 [Ensete ventricosum]
MFRLLVRENKRPWVRATTACGRPAGGDSMRVRTVHRKSGWSVACLGRVIGAPAWQPSVKPSWSVVGLSRLDVRPSLAGCQAGLVNCLPRLGGWHACPVAICQARLVGCQSGLADCQAGLAGC